MSDFKSRLLEERDALREKHDKLNLFIGSNEIFDKLSFCQQDLLKVQLMAMATYLTCLDARINNLN